MSILPLAQLALAKVPTCLLPHMTAREKTVVHYEICDNVHFPRGYTNISLQEICNCMNCGRCLCYLYFIRDILIDQYWGELSDYVTMSDWYPVNSSLPTSSKNKSRSTNQTVN